MKGPQLVVMAAGMGSRYGGLKQIDAVGPCGELILDYSVYDAARAGFGGVVFLLTEALHDTFREVAGQRLEQILPVRYAFQRLDDLPGGAQVPPGRQKPWGTGHAVYCCREVIDGPFAVINADDFYGADAFEKTASFLTRAHPADRLHLSMVGYSIENTLTENGHVARGVCTVSADGYLREIHERTRIERHDGGVAYTEDDGASWTPIPEGTPVSMNLWGFPREIMPEFEPLLGEFLRHEAARNPEKAEFFLPTVVDALVRAGRADVAVLPTRAKWYGVTYRPDRERVRAAIADMIRRGTYPERLWQA